MNHWQYRRVPFTFQLSDWILFSISLPLQVRQERLINQTPSVETPTPEASEGFLIRGLPTVAELPSIVRSGDYLCYAALQYQHCYIDLGMSFEDYKKQFSSKTRSTINRKIKKYAKHCGENLAWKTYKAPGEMRNFFQLACSLSKLTYQERLLDAGIPDTEEFICEAESLAAEQRVRAYILFDGDRPVSYLYCPVYDNVLIYSYLGYDPEYMQMSVGTVLQWLAIEQLFNEACFRYFDFTEGQSDHKRLFATHQRQCANVFLVKRTVRNTLIIYSHMFMNHFSKWLGEMLDRLGVKARMKRFLRFASFKNATS
jgi:hypothetical protein